MLSQPIRTVAVCSALLLIAIAPATTVGAQETEPIAQGPSILFAPAPAPAQPQTSAQPAEPETVPPESESDFDPSLLLLFPEPTVLPEDMELVIPARDLPSVNVPAAPTGSFIYVGVGQYGRWVDRPATRPYLGLNDSDLDDFQHEVIALWEKSPINTVWVYEIEPGPENDWAGWGPPPPGFMTRGLIPRTPEGAFLGAELPWPPAGRPPAR